MEELTPGQQAAAFHGMATNRAYPIGERLELALQALNLREEQADRLNAELERFRPAGQRRSRHWIHNPEECGSVKSFGADLPPTAEDGCGACGQAPGAWQQLYVRG